MHIIPMTSFCNKERISSGDPRTAIVDKTQTTSSGVSTGLIGLSEINDMTNKLMLKDLLQQKSNENETHTEKNLLLLHM
jgi:hypothetical protein